MRIAINTRFLLSHHLEGIGRFTHEVSRRLVAQHPEHEFLFLFDRAYDKRFCYGPNVKPVVVSPPARHPLLWWWWFERSLPRVLWQQAADIFFSPDAYCSLRSRVPTVMVTHDIAHLHYPEQIPPLVNRYYQHFVPRYLQRAERIITVSEFTKADIVEQYRLAAEKISVAGNGVSSAFRALSQAEQERTRRQYSNGQPYFFYVGAVHPRKNVARLVQAFDRFKSQTQSPVHLLIAGRLAWQTGSLQQVLANSPYRQDIKLLGYVADKDLPRLVGSALGLTYVSLFEGFGVPLLEAMHAEVPILTSKVSSMPEVVGEAGILVDPTSVEDISRGLTQLAYLTAEERAQLILKGRHQRTKFSWEQTTDMVKQAIRSLIVEI
ncbi:MAG: glycosyltransferase family 1 protein [Bacteroidetes bacterium]|nr:MAG: glycosyltransferase family 1 protein [Bacteroidota bacterium]